MKKSSNLILLAIAGVGGYFLYKRWKDKQAVVKDLSRESENVTDQTNDVATSKDIESGGEDKPSNDMETPKVATITTASNITTGVEKAKELLDTVKAGIVMVKTKTGKKAIVRKKRVKKPVQKPKRKKYPIV